MGYSLGVLRSFLLCVFFASSSFAKVSPSPATFLDYGVAGFQGMQAMRNSMGIISNVAYIEGNRMKILDESFAPTDLALDLLVQLEAMEVPLLRSEALANVTRIFNVVQRLPRHRSGLFFRVYEPQSGAVVVTQTDLSSVDNLHLALALWTLSKSDLAEAGPAAALFQEMDFSDFWDRDAKLMGGNLREHNGQWSLEAYRYLLGSEARSLYFLAGALGLMKRDSRAAASIDEALRSIPIETITIEGAPVLRVWDGGLFQLFLPTLLLGEGLYHPAFAEQARAVWGMLSKQQSALPFFNSATLIGFNVEEGGGYLPRYTGKAGHSILKNSQNPDPLMENLFVPHGALLAGLYNSQECVKLLSAVAEKFRLQKIPPFYENFGWTSAIVEGGGAVPGVVGIDKAMETLSALAMHAQNGVSVSARRLHEDIGVSERLKRAFEIVGRRIVEKR